MQEKDKQLALRYLSYRLRSEYEMRRYLSEKNVSLAEIDEIIAYLYSYRYLDDQAYAEAFIRDKINFHPCGRYKMFHELEARGISSFIIEDAMDICFSTEDELQLLLGEYKKYITKGKTYEQALKYFYNKGYPIELLQKLERS